MKPPLEGHEHRGIGIYSQELLRALQANPDVSVQEMFPGNTGKSADVIHYPYFDPFFLTLPYRHQSPFIVTVHDLIPIEFPREFPAGIRGRIKWQIQKHLLRNAALIITDSYASQAQIIEYTNVSPMKVNVVYLGVDPSFYPVTTADSGDKIKKRFSITNPFVLYVGDVNYNKNIPGLLLAFQTITERSNLDLVLVGTGFIAPSHHKERIDKQMDLLHLQSRVRVAGHVTQEELRGLYSHAACYVHPSIAEGFGLPVLEAMACGCPVVCSHTTSLGEIAAGVSMGIDPKAPFDIARGILDVVNNTVLSRTLKEKGLAHAKRFTWKRTAEETVEAYKSVIR